MNSMVLQESQLDVLARNLRNPALQAKRESLTPLQVRDKEFLVMIFLFKKLNTIICLEF